MPFLLPNQQCQSTEDNKSKETAKDQITLFIRYGSIVCWICTITVKYKYKLDS